MTDTYEKNNNTHFYETTEGPAINIYTPKVTGSGQFEIFYYYHSQNGYTDRMFKAQNKEEAARTAIGLRLHIIERKMKRAENIADKLEEYAEFLDLDGETGRSHAYDRAAREIRKTGYIPPDPSDIDNVGESVRQTIMSSRLTGEIEHLEELKDEYSYYDELRHIDHIGPSRAQQLHEELHVDTVEDLLLVGDDVTLIDGIGPKTATKIMSSANDFTQTDG